MLGHSVSPALLVNFMFVQYTTVSSVSVILSWSPCDLEFVRPSALFTAPVIWLILTRHILYSFTKVLK